MTFAFSLQTSTRVRFLQRAVPALALGAIFAVGTRNALAQNTSGASALKAGQGVQRETIAGARWISNIDRTSPRVAFSVLIRAGAADETFETAGWRRILAQAILRATATTKGTQSKEARDRQLEGWGARLGANVNDDTIEFWATADSAHSNQVLDVLLNVLQSPRLSEEDFAAARVAVRAQRAATFDDVATLATEALDTRLYRDFANRPIAYGLPDTGSSQALDRIDKGNLQNLYRKFFRPANYTIGATGDLNVSGLRDSLRTRLFNWNAQSPAVATLPRAPLFSTVVDSEPVALTRELGGAGDWVFLSYRVSDAAQNDLPALTVLAAALGSSSEGRVPQRLLIPPGTTTNPRSATFVQQASVVLVPRRWGGELVLFAQAAPRLLAPKAPAVERLQAILREEAARFRTQTLSADELQRARRFAIGTWSLDRESLRGRAFRLALDEEWQSAALTRPVWMPKNASVMSSGDAFEYSNWVTRVQSVTAAQIQNVAKRYLNVGATVYIRSGDLELN